jgi:hypothetical protein
VIPSKVCFIASNVFLRLRCDLSRFEGGDAISVIWTGSPQLYRRCDDGLEIIVKLFPPDECCEIERKIEKLMNIVHPCIAAPFGFVLPTPSKELKITRLYIRNDSLKDVLSLRRLWWRPTAKAVAVAASD